MAETVGSNTSGPRLIGERSGVENMLTTTGTSGNQTIPPLSVGHQLVEDYTSLPKQRTGGHGCVNLTNSLHDAVIGSAASSHNG